MRSYQLDSAVNTQRTFIDAAARKLDLLWQAVHATPCPASAHALLATMFETWGSQPVPASPPWPSDVGDDHAPFEFSVAFAPDDPDVRLLVEPQGGRDWHSVREASLRLNDALEGKGADLQRLAKLHPLIFPEATPARDPLFVLWHTASLKPGPMRVKAYLNPKIQGAERAPTLVQAALEDLGVAAAWGTVQQAIQCVGSDNISLFSLDLESSTTARIKVYLQPSGATAQELEQVAKLGARYVAGEVVEFCRAMAGSTGPYRRGGDVLRVPMVYLAFTRNQATPSDITVQIPIRFFVSDDRMARDRVCAYFRSRNLDPAAYERALAAAATRPLHESRGLNAWVSLRTGTSPPLITVYFAAELYHTLPVLKDLRQGSAACGMSSI
jgi:DMATS type aromatic prenyltransferase